MIGRYILLKQLGTSVWAAYDPDLDRKVAVRLVAPAGYHGEREAPLSHPNVVTIYDVGMHDGQIFIAMELIAGGVPLSTWRIDKPRGWREILGVLRGVGRGLAAAHAVGLTHGDVSAAHVLVGKDGQPRVANFGLVKPVEREDLEAFRGLLREVLPQAVPSWVARIIERPYPSLESLLVALGRDPAPRRRGVAMIGALVLVLASLALIMVKLRQGDRCTGGASWLVGAWDAERAAGLARAFVQTGSPLAAAASAEVIARLDDYAKSFKNMHVEACRATQVSHVQTAEVEELRLACLRGKVTELRALTNLFLAADADVVRNAVAATEALPDVRGCADVTTLQAVAEPMDTGTRAQVAQVRLNLADLKALHYAGKYAQAGALIEAVIADAQRAGWKATWAEALFVRGRIEDKLGHYDVAAAVTEQALWMAEAAHDNLLTLRAALYLMHVNERRSHFEDAHRWERLGLAKLAGGAAGPGDELYALRFENAAAAVAQAEGNYEASSVHAEAALAMGERLLLADDDYELAEVYFMVGLARSQLGKPAEAYAFYEKALHVWEKHLGPDHPQTASALVSMGNAEYDLGHFEADLALQKRALAIRERILGPAHPLIATVCNNAGIAADSLHHNDEALAYYQRALEVWSKTLPPDHPNILATRNNVGSLYLVTGHYAEARRELADVLALKEARLGPDHPDLIGALNSLALVELHDKDLAPAAAHAERAVAIAVAKLEPVRPEIGWSHGVLGKIRISQGKTEIGAALERQALDELTRCGEGGVELLIIPLEALADLGPPAASVPLYERALAISLKTGAPEADSLRDKLRVAQEKMR